MQKKIALFVTSVHLVILFLLCFSPVKKQAPIKKHIAVRTIQPKTQTRSIAAPRPAKKSGSSETAVAPKPQPTKQPTAKPQTAKQQPAPKKTAPKAAASKPAPVKSKPITQKKPAMVEKGKPKKTPKAPDKVLKEIDEALAKIDDKVYPKPHAKLDVPQIKGTAPLPFPDFGEMEGTDEETLGSFLSSSLNLPEFGEVKIQLTIKKDGTVARLSVLQAESKKNKAYLEKHLPLLRFPLILDEEKTFTLTFCNEI